MPNRTAGSWNDSTGPVITFQRRGGTDADVRVWTSTSAGSRTFDIAPWVGSPSYASGWCHLPLPTGHNGGEWCEFTVDLQEVLDNLDSGTTLTDIDYIEWRGEADYDTVRVNDTRTTRIYTLAPSALGGIISIRELERDTHYDIDNVDTWYHYDRLGNVALTSDDAGALNALRWQDAYGNPLASVSNGGWASAVAANGYGLTTKEYDGDVELYYFWQRWTQSDIGRFVLRDPIADPNLYWYAASNPISRIDPLGLSVGGVPWYGNWCGLGRSGPGNPINDGGTDSCCKGHDDCYGRRCPKSIPIPYLRTGQTRSCDMVLCGCLAFVRPRSIGEAAARAAILAYFCNPYRILVPPAPTDNIPGVPLL